LARVLEYIVEQHAENAAFLWLLRDKAVDAPHYKRHHLARLDERIEANLDGLRVAGEDGWRIAMAELARHQEAGELFAAGVLALESGDLERIEPLAALADKVVEARRGFSGAIGWVQAHRLKPIVRRWLHDAEPFVRCLGIAACSHHRVDPGSRLADWLTDPSPDVRARACRLAAELGRVDLHESIAAMVQNGDGAARDWAAWSAGLLGDARMLHDLETVAAGDGPVAGRALEVVARRSPHERIGAWIRRLSRDPATRRLAVRAVGALGDTAAIPWLLDRMSEPALARIAGESFSLITGADLAQLDLDGEAPGGLTIGPTDDSADENVALDPDEDLPWPDPKKVAAWWTANTTHVAGIGRRLMGEPVGLEAFERAWREGYQSQRRAAAYGLAVAQPRSALREWRSRVTAR
jgi:uncharacterized protein (TIGR02270 family)